ncbi:MAG: ribosomal RNA small subunit methyltransferase A [Ktedonobacterales bacterium]|nr:ribosomal RNA small subunit methyltransferase A [Ktedonobacterales bacterium]
MTTTEPRDRKPASEIAAAEKEQANALPRRRMRVTPHPPIIPEENTSPVGGPPDLTDRGTLRRLLARHGLHPNKSFGQHLLVSRTALDAVLEAADLAPDDEALEVGAGTGVLTVRLAARVRRVVAVELDRAILPVLRETTAPFANVEILARNLLSVAPVDVFGTAPYKLVANLPYYITSLTLRHFLEAPNPPRLLVVMVQREVAERIVAPAGGLSLLGLSVQFYGHPAVVAHVPADAFFPPPRVESAIVRIDLSSQPPLTGDARERFFGIAHAGFAEKRKQLHNNLERHLGASRETVARWLATADIAPTRRAQTLSLGEWLALTRAVLADAGEGT